LHPQDVIDVETELGVTKVRKNKWERPEVFAFDTVLPVDASQRRVYDAVCAPVVEAGYKRLLPATSSTRTCTLVNPRQRHHMSCSGEHLQ
jgi:hypothetical protein